MADSCATAGQMDRRRFLLAAGAAGMGAGASGCSRKVERTIKIGILHSMSGTMSVSEAPLRDAALLAVEEINKKGLLGRKIEPIVEDASSDPDRFQSLAEKLLVEDKVCSIFGCWTSVARKRVLPVLEAHNGLLWYPLQYEGNECSRNIIYTGSTPNQQIIPAIDWLHDRGGRRFYLVGSDYVYPKTANRIIRRHLNEIGAAVAGEEYLPLGEQDFEATLKRMMATHADIVFSTVNGDSNLGLYRAFRKIGITAKDVPIMATSMGEAEVRRIGAAWTQGHFATWAYFQSVDQPANRAFVKKFKDRYGDRRVTDDPMEAAYFQVHIWAQAVAKAKRTDVDAVRESVAGMRFDAPEGPIHIDRENRHAWKMWRVGEVQEDGQFKVVHASDGPIDPAPWDQALNSGRSCDWRTGKS